MENSERRETENRITNSLKNFDNYKFGIFIHWGVYSVPAFHLLSERKDKKIDNGSEWYLNRLNKTFRVTKSDTATKEFHSQNFPNLSYYDFANHFTASKWNPLYWVTLFKSVGAKYVIITSKHHDGFCLWPTKYSPNWNSFETGPKRDLIGELSQACKLQNLTFGVYYSWLQWQRGYSQKYLREIVKPQLSELMSYNPEIWWFDGDWIGTPEQWDSFNIVSALNKMGWICNDRLGKGTMGKIGNFLTCGDRKIPETLIPQKWEHCNTIGRSWGRNKQQELSDYKSVEELIRLLIEVITKGGNLLLNIAPDAEGIIDPIEEERLKGLGEWINIHAVGIYGTSAGPYKWSTQKDNFVYLFYKVGDVPQGYIENDNSKYYRMLILSKN